MYKSGTLLKLVMPGPQSSLCRLRKLVCAPGIHVFGATCKKDVDGRDEPGHDEIRLRGYALS